MKEDDIIMLFKELILDSLRVSLHSTSPRMPEVGVVHALAVNGLGLGHARKIDTCPTTGRLPPASLHKTPDLPFAWCGDLPGFAT